MMCASQLLFRKTILLRKKINQLDDYNYLFSSPKAFDIDLFSGHVTVEKTFPLTSSTILNIKLTVDRAKNKANEPPELQPFGGKTPHSAATGGVPSNQGISSNALSYNNNTPPGAQNQTAETNANTPLDVTLHGSSSDPHANLTAAIISQPMHGTLSDIDQSNDKVTYTPESGYTAPDSFTFEVTDGKSDSSNYATVNIIIK